MSENTKATVEILEHYHHNGGFYEIPVEIINTVEQELEEQDKEIERLNKQLQLISDEFLKYDWENSSKEQVINQLKSLYNSIFKENNIEFGSDKL